MIHSTLEISQNPLEHVDMRLARIMHVKAGLLDGIGDVRMSEREVLKSAGDASEVSGIGGGIASCR